ncbi:hypothetical protein MTR_7g095270 [Medicago truncatula]|uniref:Uncharacterized protein n=1 Tax=Medicago truncatula TaxID=3880 RepID=A0A072U266_MEDTR|nr:hypothetical protein MTR_7g095270 [Medicago truncatula]
MSRTTCCSLIEVIMIHCRGDTPREARKMTVKMQLQRPLKPSYNNYNYGVAHNLKLKSLISSLHTDDKGDCSLGPASCSTLKKAGWKIVSDSFE